MCKHLSPCPLQSCTLLTSGYALVRKNPGSANLKNNSKNKVTLYLVLCHLVLIVCDLCFSTRRVGFFLFVELQPCRGVGIMKALTGSVLTGRDMHNSNNTLTRVSILQKGLFLFLFYSLSLVFARRIISVHPCHLWSFFVS